MHRLILVWAGLMAATVAQGAAKWLAYPGDYALWTGNELMPRRIERGHGYPPFWPSYMHHPSVRFLKPVELKSPAKVRVSAKGTFMVTAGGGQLSMSGDGDECTLPAGKYTLDVLVFSQQVPPALKIEGGGFATDESWLANWHAGENLPADVFADDPALSPLRVERGRFAAVEKSGKELFGDLGREDFGFVTLTGVSGDGRARVIYAESEAEAREDDESRLECWETVLLKKGDNRLKVSRGFRYLRVIPEGDLTVDGLAFEREFYPLAETGSFHSSDERLNRIWKVSQYTLALTMREIPVEGAKRDRWTWSGDAIQSYLMNYYLFGDAKPVRDAIWYLRGGDPVVSHINNIMDYTYYWFVSVADYYRYTGDLRFLRQVYPRMVTLMDFVIGRLDAEGRPHDRSGDWVFIDWAPKPLANYGGVTSFETMLLARAMEAVAEVGEAAGASAKEVASYRARATKLRAWVKPTFWDESRGGLLHLKKDDGSLDSQFTRYPNIFGLFYGYFTEAEARRVVDGVLLNDRVMKLQTPYMRFYELEALARAGRRAKVLDEIRGYWGAMLDAGATTFWELYNSDEQGAAKYAMYGRPYGKSLCHAWGASPAYLLGRYFLGVEPTKPGFAEYVVAPDPADLALMEGAVPTPSGAVKVRVENGRVRVTGNGGKGVLRWRGREYPIAPHATVSVSAGPAKWDLAALGTPPKVYASGYPETNGVKSVFFDGEPFQGKPTRVFAYLAVPKVAPGKKVPGIVLVHGGLGSAFRRWAKFWRDAGYAAIAMDTCGCVSGNEFGSEQSGHRPHQWAGPAGWGGYAKSSEPVREQWMYHAVAAAIRANSLLGSLPEVDPGRIGITGVSWGGVITCIAASVDDRFAFAAPVYGCGGFCGNALVRSRTDGSSAEDVARWASIFDPNNFLAAAKCPFLWIDGSNDFAFLLPALQSSVDLPKSPHYRATRVRMPHAHAPYAEHPKELVDFAAFMLRSGGRKTYPRVVSSRADADAVVAVCDPGEDRVGRAELNYTAGRGDWVKREWKTLPMKLSENGTRGAAELPRDAVAWYVNFFTADGKCVSGEFFETE